MKTIIIFLFLFTNWIISNAQDTIRLYMNNDYVQTDISDATIVREAILNDDSYIFIDKTIGGKMINYSEFKSLEPRIEHGLSVHYKRPDVLYSKGYYADGQLSGIWYYYRDNIVIDSVDYSLASSYDRTKDCQLEPNSIKSKKSAKKEPILTHVDNYLLEKFILPARVRTKSEYFEVEINFIIDTLGLISCIEVPNSFDIDLDAEIIRVLKNYKSPIIPKKPKKYSLVTHLGEEVYVIIKDMPQFKPNLTPQESLSALSKYVSDRIRIPSPSCEGKVFVEFIVDIDGKVDDVKIARGIDNCPGLLDEIERVLYSSPAWIPGSQGGKNVKVKLTLPIDF